ncbi:MAG: hypothetical protein D6767_05730 [Candidatus Hydrogenedentota bacterium]|nr:MAG: hypothetical protein D6767_05730 [Candidatus Hydrogenedentota bacterium]
MAIRKAYSFSTIIVFIVAFHCASPDKKKEERKSQIQNFDSLSFQEKIQFFKRAEAPPKTEQEKKIWLSALKSSDPLLLQAVLLAYSRFPQENARKPILKLIRIKRGITRYYALKALAALPAKQQDLPVVALALSDKDWLAKSMAIRLIRNYPQEKKEGKYYYRLLVMLKLHNPDVVRELYKTLKWYHRESTFGFLYKRSFHAKSNPELIFIMRELNAYPHRLVTIRLKQLAKYHKSLIVRENARKLLRTR